MNVVHTYKRVLFSLKVLAAQLWPTLCDPMDRSPPGFSVHRILQQGYWSGLPFPSPGDLPDAGIKPGSAAMQVDFFFYHLSHQESSKMREILSDATTQASLKDAID